MAKPVRVKMLTNRCGPDAHNNWKAGDIKIVDKADAKKLIENTRVITDKDGKEDIVAYPLAELVKDEPKVENTRLSYEDAETQTLEH